MILGLVVGRRIIDVGIDIGVLRRRINGGGYGKDGSDESQR